MTVFIRMLEKHPDRKGIGLLEAVQAIATSSTEVEQVFEINPERFAAIPGSPFSYWVSDSVRDLFQRLPAFEGDSRTAKVGLQTSEDDRFVRGWWEVPETSFRINWFPFAKGGVVSAFYVDLPLCVDWRRGGAQSWAIYEARRAVVGGMIKNPSYYFRPGLTWPLRARAFSPQPLPSGCIFSLRSYCAFVAEGELLATLAIFNSSTFDFVFKAALGRFDFPEFVIGLLQKLPWATPQESSTATLTKLARRAWGLKRSLDVVHEASHAFLLPPPLCETTNGSGTQLVDRELSKVQSEIDSCAFELFGIQPADRARIEASSSLPHEPIPLGPIDHGDEEEVEVPTKGDPVAALNSWLVGVAFCRFDPRLATGERAIPPEPEPFDPLPARSPGMYPEGEEPADRPDILVDDEGHADDLVARAIAVAERVKVDALENLRAWLAKEFFPLHIKMYSKSRRKAPIYWQLATASASYSAWLYIHAFSKDTLFRVQNDYAVPKLAHEERRLESLTSELRNGATAAQRKQLATQQTLVEELRTFLDEVKRVAPLWKPNLDDGVIINFAPLWRLVPQNKAWQKELKTTWDTLCEGKYDWAHLAMHLWPERVVPKCATDRSLAIAHDVENVFWVEGTDGKWTARKTPTQSIDELVKERTSGAVKSALKSLLEAASGPTATKRKAKRQ
jgi:hypothetical protein